MEISGSYDEVVSKLQSPGPESDAIGTLAEDMEALLETVVQIDGGTRSAIASALPEDMTVSYDAEGVVEALQVLERYDLVVLEGNTWKPGPGFRE